MTRQRIRLLVKIMATTFSLAGAISVFGYGCGVGFAPIGGQSLGSSTALVTDGNGDLTIVPGQKTTSIVYSNQILRNMASVTGVSIEAGGDAEQYWRDKFDVFSEDGSATSVTGPMLLSISGLAAEVCDNLIGQEQLITNVADRRFFPSINFAGDSSDLDAVKISDVVRRMARSFWGRNETSSELSMIVSGANSGLANNGNTSAWMLYVCTGMLSSLDAIQL